MCATAVSDIRVPHFIGGQWTNSTSSNWQEVINPATGASLGKVPLAEASEVNAAIEAAAAAFPDWRRTPPEDRIQPLFKLKMLLEQHIDELARLITIENGKTLTEAKAELRRAIENVEVAAGIPSLMMGYGLEDGAGAGIDEEVLYQPLGVFAPSTSRSWSSSGSGPRRSRRGTAGSRNRPSRTPSPCRSSWTSCIGPVSRRAS